DPAVTIFDREQFRQFCQLIEATIHHEYHSRLAELKTAYAPFDPDSDAATQYELTDDDRSARCRRLFDRFSALLARANYRRLTREQLEEALRTPSDDGLSLHLDLAIFERLEIYSRGDCRMPRVSRSWRNLWQGAEKLVPTYRRLAIIFRLRQKSPHTDPLDTRAVVLKLFKNIPQQDVETLLPGANIRIGLIEQAKIVLPTISGVGLTIFKLLKGAAAVAFASLYGLIAFLALISGTIGYGVRSFYGYLRTREKYQLSLTRSLYFQNLDNNAGVLYHLVNEAEEQEFREVVLAFWLLWRGRMQNSRDAELDQAAEKWLQDCCGLAVDFEVSDALAKLQRLGLAWQSPQGRWRAVAIEQALEALDRAWDQQFAFHQAHQPTETQPTQQPRIWRAAA
ncbi:MAG: DUF3754 domain-containing protein, partial [Planctomycetaceae bacterium]|nr:DUF3754 domain-containing protein [Planctomycetaceae bacterium]